MNRSFWKRAAGYLLGAVCLAWVFHDTHLERMFDHVGSMNWWWVIPAVACDIVSYVCEGARWSYLLKPVGRLSILRATEGVYIGLFTNEVTPMRFGELVRTYLASRWMGLSISQVIPSMLVSRLLDGVWLAVGIGLLALLVPLPANLLLAAKVLGAAVLLGVIVFGAFLAVKPAAVGRIGEGLLQIGTFRTLILPAIFSLALLGLQAASFWLVMEAYHLSLPFVAGAAVLLIVRLGTAIPNAPGNVGSYQFFAVLGLGLFGVEKTAATGFSVVVFLILTLPLWALGLLALWRSGFTLATIREDLRLLRP